MPPFYSFVLLLFLPNNKDIKNISPNDNQKFNSGTSKIAHITLFHNNIITQANRAEKAKATTKPIKIPIITSFIINYLICYQSVFE